MKKNNRDQYLKTWLTYLKGKNQIDPKALADFLGKTLKGAFSSDHHEAVHRDHHRQPLREWVFGRENRENLLRRAVRNRPGNYPPVLDKCLTSNYKKIKFTDLTSQPSQLNR